jgi:NAD(P)-dependent dehydrogenase (short-subunit alcohol dehydrogenase family)
MACARTDFPLGHSGSPADVVGPVLCPCSHEASEIAGQVIDYDGGKVRS